MNKLINEIQLNRIYQRDCIEGMKMLPDDSINLIIADPPYNTGNKGTKIDMKKEYGYNYFNQKWDKIDDFGLFNLLWITECYRVLKPGGSILSYGTHHNLFTVGYLMEETGFKIKIKYEWKKKNPPPAFAGRTPRFSTESIIWGIKGKAPVYNHGYARKINNGINITNVFETALTPKSEKAHGKFPCQKPLEISIKLINLHSRENDIVLIPFGGSGTECVAAEVSNRNFIAFETEPSYIELANMRLDSTTQYKDKFKSILDC
ncbi:site-specific DNA-methyltransferase (adenine-specific) [Fontibacillus phaseoli]|uniref:Methyltransferase n=1 Tax=Fontibacillus phaseoli TaxID=1416533 RepID=A0A369B522_9BACL|nr:site-specific DNA-methyltransferase [Fontibacillus phaseoli]RCX15636.1 site-specific DNA-methyltransferase (adenine-specific) [Fontibacillus phaseoli]